MVREAIFNMIGPIILDAVVLDLFSGSGLLGLEAKSRGAREVFFVEHDKAVCRILRRNLSTLLSTHQSPILCTTAQRALRQFRQAGIRFDIVLLDPPYQMDVNPILKSLCATDIVKAEGWIVLERGKAQDMHIIPEGLIKIREKIYGSSRIYIFQPGRSSTESEA
jgi:16S rRNA (guanine(966)-N(2))-methyltransferase RsmD